MLRVSGWPAAALAALLLAACDGRIDGDEQVGRAASPIAGGYDDDSDHAVVGLAMLDRGGQVFRTCSGTLIADTLVLTAQHCIAETATFVDCPTSSFGPPLSGDRVRITCAPSMWESAIAWHSALDVLVPPGPPVVCGRDVALVILRERVAEDEASPITPQLDRRVEDQEMYTAIGYGTSSEGGTDAGIRRRRDQLIVSCVGPDCGSTDRVDGREWRGDQGICNGDSGGPALDEDRTLIGVTSRGPLGCASPIYGGLTAYKQWIRATAVDAARVGDYEQPWWVARTTADGPVTKAELPTTAWAGCGMHAGRSSGGEGAAYAAGAFASLLLAIAKRRRRSPSTDAFRM